KAEKLLRIVPGIRMSRVSTEDQTRVATPKDAAENGASYIVVGRPLLEAPDPVAAAKNIINMLAEVRR
ncbi:MAG: orotidine 5'-phosphate decarboxylase / HUMPS family protein, partial [Synergistaceae bacterium]|nr:orotidine 5'-phosphate decarboxylase / HUMPS family protein [Synergistaceae bacterium]